MSNDRSENKDCRSLKEALTSYHSELVSELGGIEAELKACHDEQQSEEANATVKQRQLATDTYRQETSQANLRTTATLQNLIEGRYAKRKETMAASNKPGTQKRHSATISCRNVTNGERRRLSGNHGRIAATPCESPKHSLRGDPEPHTKLRQRVKKYPSSGSSVILNGSGP